MQNGHQTLRYIYEKLHENRLSVFLYVVRGTLKRNLKRMIVFYLLRGITNNNKVFKKTLKLHKYYIYM